MIQYICPQCNELMTGPFTILASCKSCDIMYFFSCPLNDRNNESYNFYFNLVKVYHGSFKECCRAFKLKVFL